MRRLPQDFMRTLTVIAIISWAVSPCYAGDILRGGAVNIGNRVPDNRGTTPAQAAELKARADDTLARTAQALQSVKNMQEAARAQAAGRISLGVDPNNPAIQLGQVPNGLTPGGLQVASGATPGGPLWSGADLPVQTTSAAGVNVTVKQRASQALLNWDSFNVGSKTHLHFDQSAGGQDTSKWIAFNQVNDPSGRPSQILGKITADGQIYVINQNGIIFGGASQVNAHTLVASSLPLNYNLVNRGLLNQTKTTQFLFSAFPQAGEPTFTPPAPPASGQQGNIVVQAGARLEAPTNEANVGGRIVLVGANVYQRGQISTPDGQTILAAGLQVGFSAHDSTDPSLRGLDTYVGKVGTYAGRVENTGLIEADRGNVTLTGKDILHSGAITSTTNVALNGRIDIRAEYNAVVNNNFDPLSRTDLPFLYGGVTGEANTGTITFTKGSLLRILPEWGSPDKVPGKELRLKSQVNVRGSVFHMQSGSTILAPNAQVMVETGKWDFDATQIILKNNFVREGGQIYLDSDAVINAAGRAGAFSPLENWILKVSLRGSELADAPIQRTNPLIRGQEVTVDLRKTGTYNGVEWVGTPLADLTGYLNLVERTVDELTVGAGSVRLLSGGSVIAQRGSIIDVSAGYLNVAGGQVRTTRLLYGGRLFDISQATPDRVYQGIYTGEFKDIHPNWGITHTYKVPWMTGEHYEQPYLQGVDGGLLRFAGSSMALDGNFFGRGFSGPRQYDNPSKGGSLELDFEIQKFNASAPVDPIVSPTPPDIVFGDKSQRPANPFSLQPDGTPTPLRGDRVEKVILSPNLLAEEGGGFGSLRIRNPDGNITVPRGVNLRGGPRGEITLQGANVRVDGKIAVVGGAISLTAFNISPSVAEELNQIALGNAIPAANPARGMVSLGEGAVLNASGQVVDQRTVDNSTFGLPQVINGGKISIASYSADLAEGSVLDVSGGAIARATGAITYGRAGSIEILTGRDQSVSRLTGGTLRLKAELKGYSGLATGGGSLTLQAQQIQIGGQAFNENTLLLEPEFFSEGGFASFVLRGLGGKTPGSAADDFLPAVLVADGTKIRPKVKSWLGVPFATPEGTLELIPIEKPEYLRQPVSISLQAPGVLNEFAGGQIIYRGDIRVGRGALIETDPLGSVTLTGQTVALYGTLQSPGGNISLKGANLFPSADGQPSTRATVYLAPGSVINAAGQPQIYTDRWGNKVGRIIPGGVVNVEGNIIAESGALIDVSGSTGVLSVHPQWLGLNAYGQPQLAEMPLVPSDSGLLSPLYPSLAVSRRFDSNGGSVNLRGGNMLFSDATLRGAAGGSSAQGGTLTVSSGRFSPNGDGNTAQTNLVVTQSGRLISGTFAPLPYGGIGQIVRDETGAVIPGLGYFTADTFQRGGFSSLTLGGNVEFRGPVNISAKNSLRVATGGVIRADDIVNLRGDYVALGQAFRVPSLPNTQVDYFQTLLVSQPFTFAPTAGPGVLNVTANHIDIGTLSLDGISKAHFKASGGDIRGNGYFQMRGELQLTAAQIYPTSGSPFQLYVYDTTTSPGRITVSGSGVKNLPLSAAGSLGLYASEITQGGVLRAPLGQIQLGWDGTGTAPINPLAGNTVTAPITKKLTLSAGSITSISAIDPITGRGVTIPYGIVEGGDKWIAPSGLDITALGPPEKRLVISAAAIDAQPGSTIDIRGGGDLLAYRWVPGVGGSRDVLANTNAFAIIPGYDSTLSPYAPFGNASNFAGDIGYANSSLKPGDQIWIDAGPGIPAGSHTLLPARYALLPGAFLVTPQSGDPIGYFRKPDGSYLVSAYRYNLMNPGVDGSLRQRWEVAPFSVVSQRSKYELYTGDTFFPQAAEAINQPTPRLAKDSGRLLLQVSNQLSLGGNILGQSLSGGRGALVDISSPQDIYIKLSNTDIPAGALYLNSSQLSGIGAESLLIGGARNGNIVTVSTNRLTLDNAGGALSGNDVILVAKDALTLAEGAELVGRGNTAAEKLVFGGTAAGSGNGLLVRASGDSESSIQRLGVTPGGNRQLTVGDNVKLSGGSITLDSTGGTQLSPAADINATTVNLSSGQVSVLLDNPGQIVGANTLVLAGRSLETLVRNAKNLNLNSYSSIDLYGTGSLNLPGNLRLNAGELRGFNQNAGIFDISANVLTLANPQKSAVLGVAGVSNGSLRLQAQQIILDEGLMAVSQFQNVIMNATQSLQVARKGSLSVSGNIQGTVPQILSGPSADYLLKASGDMTFDKGVGSTNVPTVSLGGKIHLEGSSVTLNSDVIFPSGQIMLTSATGPITIGGLVSAAGTRQNLYDIVRFTDAGQIRLISNGGNIILNPEGVLDVSAPVNGGSAGLIALQAPNHNIQLDGVLRGRAPAGQGGRFSLDIAALPALSSLTSRLAEGGFTGSQDFRVRTGNVVIDGSRQVNSFSLAADQGSINVTGTINASGRTGGQIFLYAHENLTLSPTAQLLARGEIFSTAGKGGHISLNAGSQTAGVIPTTGSLDMQSGSVIDLGVDSWVAGSAITPGSSSFKGQFTGTLHLRAPQNGAGNDLRLNTIGTSLTGVSALQIEGYKLYDLTSTSGAITSAVQNSVRADGTTFGNESQNILARVLPGGSSHPLASVTVISPGAEVINRTGSLTLGTPTTNATADWDLSGYRFGAQAAPGVLTLRSAGDLVFYNSLSDGFQGGSSLWLAPLMAQNSLLPVNLQSYSYQLTAGADFSAVSPASVRDLTSLNGTGSLLLGKNYTNAAFSGVSDANALTERAIDNGNRLQVVRTGSGDIRINAGVDVQILNTFASIYTAGTSVANPTTLYTAGDFTLPVLDSLLNANSTVLGKAQQNYPAQYAMAGGNVSIIAGADIARYTFNATTNSAVKIDDASRQIPGNWLYRRGFVDPLTGQFGLAGAFQGGRNVVDPHASTTWWVDYSNFFQSVGTLGGGNVLLQAGRHVSNVDAVAPTNARAAQGVPDANRYLELGGGNISVIAAADIYGGTYYVERGDAQLSAGGSITLRSTRVGSVSEFNPRSPSTGIVQSLNTPSVTDPQAWIPTLGFLGRGSFDFKANQDILLGSITNVFLNPAGINNKYWYKTYYNTFDDKSRVSVLSLGGNITHRLSVTLPTEQEARSTLGAWLATQHIYNAQVTDVDKLTSIRQPWLRTSDSQSRFFDTSSALHPGTLISTALQGDVNLVGRLLLSPSPTGTIEIAAGGSISGIGLTGLNSTLNSATRTPVWDSTNIVVSDASPQSLPGVFNPLAMQGLLTRNAAGLVSVNEASRGEFPFYTAFDNIFNESGSYTGNFGTTQIKRALHDPNLLHKNDTQPLRLYSLGGDISGLTLFAPKQSSIIASRDIDDIAFYLQNVNSKDVSIISAGRDLIPYNPNSILRSRVTASGGILSGNPGPLVGDIQISGPGTLEILAGRNFTLGAAPLQSDGTGDGISSIGNIRNPFLPQEGANLILAAGLGANQGLAGSQLNFEEFIAQYVKGGEGAKYLSELGITDFDSLTPEAQNRAALGVFYQVLRQAGRDFSVVRNYDAGTQAIETLFGNTAGTGNINLSSRSLKTRAKGDISILAPSGSVSLGTSIGSTTAPPGIVTESGGNINIFSRGSVDVGVLRIFTLRGGDIVVWSAEGDVAAGSASRTVASAPPTRVVIDSQSADVATDLAGLSTGGGIGVLTTVKNVKPGNVDLVAPQGAVDAGDAGIRSAGNLTIAAQTVLNAGNIAVSGSTTGAPAAPSVAAPSVSAAPPPPPVAQQTAPKVADNQSVAQNTAQAVEKNTTIVTEPDSDIEVKVLGYGGGNQEPSPAANTEEDEEERRRKEREAQEKSEQTQEQQPSSQ